MTMVYLASLIVPILSLAVLFTDSVYLILTPMAYVFLLIPILDTLPVKIKKSSLSAQTLNYFLYFISFFYLLVFATLISLSPSMGGVELILKSLTTGLSGGVIAINCAHELGHRHTKWETFFAKILLFTTSYTHFYIEHNKGHHKWVATHEDPATARFNESLYAFFPRTIINTFLSAFRIESLKKPLYKNEVFYYVVLELIFIILLYMTHSNCVVAYLLHSALAIILLEAVNYIEHYGIMRKMRNGKYEKVTPIHSWNSDHVFSRIHLFELSRHSHHHAMANVPFYDLESIEKSPQMPYGYAGMILMAFVPPLWFKIMNQRVTADQKN